MKADATGSARLCPCVPLTGSRFVWEWLNPTACAGKVGLDEDSGRYFSQSTGFTLVHLINPEIVVQHAGNHARAGTNFNTCRYRSPIGTGVPLAGSGQVEPGNSLS
jgi:hypothetical protein